MSLQWSLDVSIHTSPSSSLLCCYLPPPAVLQKPAVHFLIPGLFCRCSVGIYFCGLMFTVVLGSFQYVQASSISFLLAGLLLTPGQFFPKFFIADCVWPVCINSLVNENLYLSIFLCVIVRDSCIEQDCLHIGVEYPFCCLSVVLDFHNLSIFFRCSLYILVRAFCNTSYTSWVCERFNFVTITACKGNLTIFVLKQLSAGWLQCTLKMFVNDCCYCYC